MLAIRPGFPLGSKVSYFSCESYRLKKTQLILAIYRFFTYMAFVSKANFIVGSEHFQNMYLLSSWS